MLLLVDDVSSTYSNGHSSVAGSPRSSREYGPREDGSSPTAYGGSSKILYLAPRSARSMHVLDWPVLVSYIAGLTHCMVNRVFM